MAQFIHPIKDFQWGHNISQFFGVGKEIYHPRFGIPGHNGVDYRFPLSGKHGYGEPVLAAHDGRVTKIFSDFPNKTQGTGIYIYEDTAGLETIYWHLSDVDVKVGQKVTQGDIIGKVGNTGFVFPKPTPNDPWAGSHLHFAVRFYINGELQQNEYGGFIDPVPLLYNEGEKLPLVLPRNLFVGSQGNDISYLQTLMKLEKIADYEPIGYFGFKTRASIAEYQKEHEISPAYGYCGEKTRKSLLDTYSLFT